MLVHHRHVGDHHHRDRLVAKTVVLGEDFDLLLPFDVLSDHAGRTEELATTEDETREDETDPREEPA